jgi:hypothetical protein
MVPEASRKRINVLVFPGGTEIGLEVHKSLSWCKEINLYSAGSAVSSHAPYVFSRHVNIPSVHNPEFIDSLNGVIDENGIDFVIPAHDDVIVALAQNSQKIHARIVTSPLTTCLIARSKSETYRVLSDSIPVPVRFPDADVIERFPVFVKPDRGQGSQHAQVVHNARHLEQALATRDDLIILEYLPGEEFTIDCFSDRERGLLFCGARQRIRTRSGISMDSTPVQDDIWEEYAKQISRRLEFHGAWFFQAKRDRHGIPKLLEVAPRIAGTMSVNRVLGVNFPLLSIFEQLRIPIEIRFNKIDVQLDRALVNRYRHELSYQTIYIDLDDTLVVNGRVNTEIVRFLYQCVNTKKRIVLLTKHAGDLDQTLRKHRLTGIFDEVIQMDQSANKSDYIHSSDAIFIDDSFSERKAVSQRLGILTFDCSMLEMLIDDRA